MRADRLISLLLLLQTRGRMTAADLAQELNVSVRTIYRDLDALGASGVPVYTERGPGGGCALLDSFRTSLNGFTPEELAWLQALRLPEPLAHLELADAARSAMIKLQSALPREDASGRLRLGQRLLLDWNSWFEDLQPLPHLAPLQQALWQDRALELDMALRFGARVTLTVLPLGLVAKAGHWYAVVRSRERIRVLDVAQIIALRPLPGASRRPPDFDLPTFWEDWCRREANERPRYKTRLRIAPQFVENLPLYLAERSEGWSLADKADSEGWRTLEIAFDNLMQARATILGWGRGCAGAGSRAAAPERARFCATDRPTLSRLTAMGHSGDNRDEAQLAWEGSAVSQAAFGNDPRKLERYRAFWSRADVQRPLVGFTLRGWFPVQEYAASRAWPVDGYLLPDMVQPEAFVADEARLLAEGEFLNDDIIRGEMPAAAVLPWFCAMVGADLRILPSSVLGEERTLSWDEMLALRLNEANPWVRKYLEMAEALVAFSAGRFPVSHGALVGASDILGLLRGHTQSVLDIVSEPAQAARALDHFAELFIQITEMLWQRVPQWHGGYFDGMYQLWAPGPICRMQEDASGIYSPKLYRQFLQPLDRRIAERFSHCFVHLHSTSMFLLDAFLEIEALRCFEINFDALGPPIEAMIPYYQRAQRAGRSLIVRGSFTPSELTTLVEALDPRGLYLLILLHERHEAEALRPIVGL